MNVALQCLCSLIFFIVDRITKSYALSIVHTCVVSKFLSFELCLNNGISWGLFASAHRLFQLFLVCLMSALLLLVLFFGYQAFKKRQEILPYALIFMGGISNVYDRIMYNGVIDFISLNCNFIFFDLTFNVADIMILIGLLLLLLQGEFHDRS
jgi:signal peptidase II